jgi:hypothetical protein
MTGEEGLAIIRGLLLRWQMNIFSSFCLYQQRFQHRYRPLTKAEARFMDEMFFSP